MRLLASEHQVTVWNRSPNRMSSLVELGAVPAATPAEAARRSGLLITMVADPLALRAVTEGPAGVAAGAGPGLTVVEMSTVGPASVARLARVLPSGTIDAPVLGSVAEAESGSLTMFVGGEARVVEQHGRLLSILGSVVRVGDLGAGAAAKLVANAALFGTLGLLGEALALADGLGLSRTAAYQVLAATRLATPASRRRISIESGDFPPRFKLRLARKDAKLIRAAARASGLRLPITLSAGKWLDSADEAGVGDRDHTAMLAAILNANKAGPRRNQAAITHAYGAGADPRFGQSGRPYDGFIVDLDGVIWRGDQPIAGAAEAIGALRSRGIRILFLTNEPRNSKAEVATRLTKLGIAASEADVITSVAATARVLAALADLPSRKAFVIGPPALHDEIRAAEFQLVPSDDAAHAAVVVVGGHEGFDYDELLGATAAIRHGARLFATGRDAVFPTPYGPRPATGAILAAVEAAGGATATVVGKPERAIFEIAREALAGCEHVAVVGDSLIADVEGAKRAGLDAILVLTGSSTRADLGQAIFSPDLVLDSLSALSEMMSST